MLPRPAVYGKTERAIRPASSGTPLLSTMCEEGQAKGAMVMDAHLAALAMEHGASIATTDRDFMRFPGIELVNPVKPTA